MDRSLAIGYVVNEMDKIWDDLPSFKSYQEGLAATEDHIALLEGAVEVGPNEVLFEEVRDAAIQVAAMALRFLIDLC